MPCEQHISGLAGILRPLIVSARTTGRTIRHVHKMEPVPQTTCSTCQLACQPSVYCCRSPMGPESISSSLRTCRYPPRSFLLRAYQLPFSRVRDLQTMMRHVGNLEQIRPTGFVTSTLRDLLLDVIQPYRERHPDRPRARRIPRSKRGTGYVTEVRKLLIGTRLVMAGQDYAHSVRIVPAKDDLDRLDDDPKIQPN
jgi:hypothetical protein